MSDYQQKYFEEKFSDLKADLKTISVKIESVQRGYATKDFVESEVSRVLEKVNLEKKRIDRIESVAGWANKIILGAILAALLALVVKTGPI